MFEIAAKTVAIVEVTLAVAVLAAACGGSGPTGSAPSPATDEEPEPVFSAQDRFEGRHCLDPETGGHTGLEDQIRDRLNDPTNLEVLETITSPADEHGDNYFFIDFTAKNRFGVRVHGAAAGRVDNQTCEAELLEIE